jgi:phenylacetate-CoA ligase
MYAPGVDPSTMAAARHLRSLRRLLRSPERIRRAQLDGLLALLEVAAATPAYRELYPTPLPPVSTAEDLARLPVIDRSTLAELPMEARLAPGARPEVRSFSSGTSGVIFHTARSRAEERAERALWMRPGLARGWPTSRTLMLRLGNARWSEELTFDGAIAFIGAFAPPPVLARAVLQVRPDLLVGPPNSLLEIGGELGGYRARGVLSTAEQLDEGMRTDLADGFDCEVVDVYATSEAGPIAWQCPARDGYHVNADAVVVETLDDEGRPTEPGTVGEVTLTVLFSRTMPLVRYRVGDLAALDDGACTCGIALPRMGRVEGRSFDRMVTRDGRLLSPWRFGLANALGDDWMDATRTYRVVQRGVGDFLVEAVWRAGPRPDLQQRIEETYARTLGEPVTVELRSVTEVPRDRSGKVRILTSLVARAAHATAFPS